MTGLNLCINGIVPMAVPVEYLDGDGKTRRGSFTAHVRDLSREEIGQAERDGRDIVDLILHSVSGLTLSRTDAPPVPEDELLDAVKDSFLLRAAVLAAYKENFLDRTPRRRT